MRQLVHPALLTRLLQRATDLRYRRIYIETDCTNLASQRGIAKVGFTCHGQARRYRLCDRTLFIRHFHGITPSR